MKSINILLLCLLCSYSFSQNISEKEVKTVVKEVTVFIKGAQITRTKTIDLPQGKTIIKFVDLSPFIDPKSVQVKADGKVTIMSVNHQQNFLDKLEKPKEQTNLEDQLRGLNEKVKLENIYMDIIREEIAFLQSNKVLGGRNQEVSLSNFKETSEFYGSKLTALKLKEIEHNKTLFELLEQQNDIKSQLRNMTSKKEYSNGEILVKVDAQSNARASFELSYVVGNTGWFPSYDIRAKNINEPVELIYKANVKQDTKVDWKNIKLKFSSSDPNVSGVAPELRTYFLSYNTLPPSYGERINMVNGIIRDQNNDPLPGATVVVEGTTIGTIANTNGGYSLLIPNNASHLKYSFIGYNSQILPISSSQMNVVLQPDMVMLDEVVISGYGTQAISPAEEAMSGRVAGVSVNKKSNIRIRGSNSLPVPTQQIERQTTVDFEINTPYTINSDNKNYSVDMEVYNLPSFYQYFCVPKIDNDAFLIANIIDWEKYNLLEGEANIFFEETYIGKTLLDLRYASDTLQISLGRDKNVAVSREKIKDFTTKKFLGSKKEEARAWRISVKNNKSQEIDMIVLDQIPVSTLEEIEIEVQKNSGAKHNIESGEIKWEFSLDPNDKKDFELRYSVKYPKHQNLIIE